MKRKQNNNCSNPANLLFLLAVMQLYIFIYQTRCFIFDFLLIKMKGRDNTMQLSSSFLTIPGTITPNPVSFEYQPNQFNPELPATVWIVERYGSVTKHIFEPRFRFDKEMYRQFEIFAQPEHAQFFLEERVKLAKRIQYELYGTERQAELFPELVKKPETLRIIYLAGSGV